MMSCILTDNIQHDWLTSQVSEYLNNPRGLHMRDVPIKAFVVQGWISTWGSIFGFVEKGKAVAPHACWHTNKTQCTTNPSHYTLETAFLSILLENIKVLHLMFAGPNTHIHTCTLKTSHHNQRCSGCGKSAIAQQGSSLQLLGFWKAPLF